MEAADPDGGERVGIRQVVVVRGERGAATADGAPESELLRHGGAGIVREEG